MSLHPSFDKKVQDHQTEMNISAPHSSVQKREDEVVQNATSFKRNLLHTIQTSSSVIQCNTKGGDFMGTISVRLDEEDARLIREYAKTKNLTLSTLVRDAVLERIEDELDLKLYHEAMNAHRKQPEAISFDDMMEELNAE